MSEAEMRKNFCVGVTLDRRDVSAPVPLIFPQPSGCQLLGAPVASRGLDIVFRGADGQRSVARFPRRMFICVMRKPDLVLNGSVPAKSFRESF